MAPFIDPGINDLIRDYYTSGCDTKFLYGGSQEHIIVELHAWILRREEIIRTQHEMHVKMVDIPLKFNKSSPETPQERATWAEGLRDMEYCKVSSATSESQNCWRFLTLAHRLLMTSTGKTMQGRHISFAPSIIGAFIGPGSGGDRIMTVAFVPFLVRWIRPSIPI